MTVPFLDLKSQYASIKTEVDEAVLRVLASTTYVLGPEVEAFEKEFAALHNVKHAVAVNTGTSALHVALLAAGSKTGDEVITVSMTFIATVSAIRYAGATPVFVDVDPVTCTMDVDQIEARITPRTRAIMPVHLYGQPADMDPIMEIAKRRNLIVIEDAAQAHASEYNGRRVGGIGHVAGFSFYPGKNLGAYGEAGIATTNDDKYAHTMRLLRDWGQEKKYYHDMHAFNYRMDAIQGAILRVSCAGSGSGPKPVALTRGATTSCYRNRESSARQKRKVESTSTTFTASSTSAAPICRRRFRLLEYIPAFTTRFRCTSSELTPTWVKRSAISR